MIVLAFVSIAVIAVVTVGAVSFRLGSATLRDESFSKLTAVREMKADQIEDLFRELRREVVTLSENPMIVDAMRSFGSEFANLAAPLPTSGFDAVTPEIGELADDERARLDEALERYYEEEYLPRLVSGATTRVSLADVWPRDELARLAQGLFIADNPFSVGNKYLLDDPAGATRYGELHARYHPILRRWTERFSYYDLFLIDVRDEGRIVYSVFKELDFATSLVDGPYAQSNFAAAFRSARASLEAGSVDVADFEPYAPSYFAPAAFLTSPIFDGDVMIGILGVQIPVDRINDIMTSRQSWSDVGLGESGETYIVGDDFLLRNQSRFLIDDSENYFAAIESSGIPPDTRAMIQRLDSTIGLQPVDTEGTRSALAGVTGTAIFADYRGVPVLSAFKPLDIPGVTWVIMSEIDRSEAFAAIRNLALRIMAVVGGLLVVFVALAFAFARRITRPLKELTAAANELATGNLGVAIPAGDQGGEIGVLASSFDSMRLSMKDLIENLERRVAERTAELEAATERVRSIVENASDAIITIDMEQNIVLFNPQAEEVFGYTAEEVVGRPLTMLMPESSRSVHPQEIRSFRDEPVTSRGMDLRRAVHALRKDGSRFPAEAGISKMRLGDQLFFTAFLRDITERRRLEVAIESANERMSLELNFARDIQIGMLPLIFPAFPQREEFDLHALLHSAREVGGDFYDFYFVDEDRICLVIADVSGKGAPGALLMAVAKTLVKSRAADDHQPSSILTHVNDELSRNNEAAMFVTVFLGILDVRTGEFLYTNAGHNPPFLRRADGSVERIDALHGPVIGALSGMTYGQDRLLLSHGDSILLYTDGVTEAMDAHQSLYGVERLSALLEAGAPTTPRLLAEAVLHDVLEHQGAAEQADDITILAVQYTGTPEQAAFDRLALRIGNVLAELDAVEEQFHEFALRNHIPDAIRQPVSIVLDEMLNNIISYAYLDEERHEIDIRIELTGLRLVLTITDDGVPFNPFGRGAPDTSLAVGDRDIGGLGIHLVRNMMDEYLYQRHIDRNVVTLVKVLDDLETETR